MGGLGLASLAIPGVINSFAKETSTGKRPNVLFIPVDDLSDWHSVSYCVKQMQKKRNKPFFLSCGLVKPNLPWAIPRKYYDMFPLDKIDLPPHIENDLADVPEAGRKPGACTDNQTSLRASARKKRQTQSEAARKIQAKNIEKEEGEEVTSMHIRDKEISTNGN